MEYKYEQILSKEFSPLIPHELIEEYKDFIDPNLRNVLRSNCLRRYLEGAIDLLLKEKIINIPNFDISKLDEYNLNNKIQAIGKYYDKDIKQKFDELRKIGNEGSHYGNEVSDEDLKKGINIATRIFEMVFIKYFKDCPIGSQKPVMSMLSILPPIHRVFILEALWENGQKNDVVIDKLSMAYLKSGKYNKSLEFLENLKNDGSLSQVKYGTFVEKINILNDNLHKMPISKNVFDVKKFFSSILKNSEYTEYQEFIKIFLVLVSGYNMED